MKISTNKITHGLIAVAMLTQFGMPGPACAAPTPGALAAAVATPAPKTVDVASEIRLARAAIRENKWNEVEQHLLLSESVKVKYPLFYFGDTPAKLRKDYDAYRRANPKPVISPFAETTPLAPVNRVASAAATARNSAAANPVRGLQAPNPFTPNHASNRTAVARSAAQPLPALTQPTSMQTTLQQASATAPIALPPTAQQALYQPLNQNRGVRSAAFQAPVALPSATNRVPVSTPVQQVQFEATPENIAVPAGPAVNNAVTRAAEDSLRKGEDALRSQNKNLALQHFNKAYESYKSLSEVSQQRLQDHLQMLNAPARLNPSGRGRDILTAASDSQKVLARQLAVEIGKRQSEILRLRAEHPGKALRLLQDVRRQVSKSQLPESLRSLLEARVERSFDELERYIEDHRAELELNEANRLVLEQVKRRQEYRLQLQHKIQELISKYNELNAEQRYPEAELVAKRLQDLAPNHDVVRQITTTSKMQRRLRLIAENGDKAERNRWEMLHRVDTASHTNLTVENPIDYGDKNRWNKISKNRGPSNAQNSHMSKRERDLQQRLLRSVRPQYIDQPLSVVLNQLEKEAGVELHVDAQGLEEENITSSQLVTLNLRSEISLKSALNLILEPLRLGYVIRDEVIMITSENRRKTNLITVTYEVADLVIPIPNAVPNSGLGLQQLINDAHAALGHGSGIGVANPLATTGSHPAANGTYGNVLGNQNSSANGLGSPMSGGGLGGAANADFDSLIDLITSVVVPESWAASGTGSAEIQPFSTPLSLVISQTQDVHEKIASLLKQLRKLQDLQIVVEVRFIRLSDSFFERIGIDFDFDIKDKAGAGLVIDPNTGVANHQEGDRSRIIGNGIGNTVTADLDLKFAQSSFDLTLPQFGGVTANPASFGFAILSDIEAYFLINAAQGDRRANVLQAPKVTLFNGQQAFVSDTSQRPFVVSLIPIVGEFAVAQQPVIVVLSEGTMMSIQAVVSPDRRYVRMTVVPFFSTIGDVDTFTFEGSTTTTKGSKSTDANGDGKDESNDDSETTVTRGTTVQLPTFQFISVTTTVSVPDGGTVLLGGIKRLSEGRSEYGVPLLSKIPYINRLFSNVGIGRDTDSLMMMVTPRIIIQEEEEAALSSP